MHAPKPQPQPQIIEWLNKDEASKRLKVSTRSVLAMAAAGKIQRKPWRDPSINQTVILLHAGDVERIAYERDHPEAVQPAQAAPHAVQTPNAVGALNQSAALVPPWLTAILGQLNQPPAPKLWLTLDEAAEYSGIPADVLHDLIRREQLAALDTHHRGNKYLIRRKTLEEFDTEPHAGGFDSHGNLPAGYGEGSNQ